MARYTQRPISGRCWQASVQFNYRVYWLGAWHTKDEAIVVEEHFKQGLRQITQEAHSLWQAQLTT